VAVALGYAEPLDAELGNRLGKVICTLRRLAT
jgi:hypothetical protein